MPSPQRFDSLYHATQVEVSGGRGKPSIIVDKDESLAKVIASELWNNSFCHLCSFVNFILDFLCFVVYL